MPEWENILRETLFPFVAKRTLNEIIGKENARNLLIKANTKDRIKFIPLETGKTNLAYTPMRNAFLDKVRTIMADSGLTYIYDSAEDPEAFRNEANHYSLPKVVSGGPVGRVINSVTLNDSVEPHINAKMNAPNEAVGIVAHSRRGWKEGEVQMRVYMNVGTEKMYNRITKNIKKLKYGKDVWKACDEKLISDHYDIDDIIKYKSDKKAKIEKKLFSSDEHQGLTALFCHQFRTSGISLGFEEVGWNTETGKMVFNLVVRIGQRNGVLTFARADTVRMQEARIVPDFATGQLTEDECLDLLKEILPKQVKYACGIQQACRKKKNDLRKQEIKADADGWSA